MNIKNPELHKTFPTPIWTSIIPNFEEVNERMYNYIISLQKNNPNGITKSNLLGWHSEDFDLEK